MSLQQVQIIPPTAIPLYVNSKDRFDGTPSNFRCPQLANIEQSERMFGLIVKEISFENLLPVITAGVNDVLAYIVNGNEQELILTPGQYDALSIAETLQAAFQDVSPLITVSYDSTSYKLLLFIPPGVTFRLPRQTEPRNNLLLEKLGWTDNVNINYINTTMVGSDSTKIAATSIVFITLANVDLQVMSSSSQGLQILAGIPIEYGYGSIIKHTPPNPNMFRVRSADVENMTFVMVDEWGYIVDLPTHTSVQYHFALVPLSS